MYEDLTKLGCGPCKSYNIRFPSSLKVNLKRHFVRGYCDGDGHIRDMTKYIENNESEKMVVDITSNFAFIEGLKEHLQFDLGFNIADINVRSGREEDDNPTSSITISSLDGCKLFLNYIYKDASFFLERKFNSYKNFLDYYVINGHKSKSLAIRVGKKRSTDKSNFALCINDKCLTQKYLSDISEEEKTAIASDMLTHYRSNGFPFIKLDDKMLISTFTNLRRRRSGDIVNNNIIETKDSLGTNIVKHFSPHIYECRGSSGKQSIMDAFNSDELLLKVIEDRLEQKLTISETVFRNGFSNSFVAFNASNFNVLAAKCIYDTFCSDGDIVFDYCMGYGHRLLGSLVSNKNITYVGTDPYKKSYESNVAISNFFNSKVPDLNRTVDLYNLGSENFCDEKYLGKVNLAFSSPPYFDLEIYEDNESQAYHKGYDHFINVWWEKTVQNIEKMLCKNGLFILNVKDIVDNKYLSKDMIEVLEKHGFEFFDKLNLRYTKNAMFRTSTTTKLEPIYIFKKMS